MCMFGRVQGACMLGGVGIRNRLRGNWTAGRRSGGGRKKEGWKGGREGGRADGEAGLVW